MSGALAIQLRKEARALLPAWLGVAAILTTALLLLPDQGSPRFKSHQESWVILIYALGVLSVSALSFGHELTHGTLSSLLVQPIGRLRVLGLKFVALVPAVLVLGILADRLFGDHLIDGALRVLLVWGPVFAAVGLVPLITLLTRRPIAGIVFSTSLVGLVLTAANVVYPSRLGDEAWSITSYGTVVMAALGTLGLVFLFPKLQAVGETAGSASSRPESSHQAAHRMTPRHWVGLLIRKEFRLQYLTLALSGIHVVGVTLITVAQRLDPSYVGPTFLAVSELHGGFIALVAGCLASAEERHLGMTAAQALLPLPAWREWAIKIGVTLAVVVTLSAGLPMLLTVILRPPVGFFPHGEYVVAMILIACAALYVSSLSTNTLWALLATIPVIGVAFAVTSGLTRVIGSTLQRWMPIDYRELGRISDHLYRSDRDAYIVFRDQLNWVSHLERNLDIIVPLGTVALALYFAARNHRSLERGTRLIATQAAGFLIFTGMAALACFAIIQIAWTTVDR